jgi:type VI secretion system ImpC/EvpB family protein/type VI secretion system ImpB/VipA family protein
MLTAMAGEKGFMTGGMKFNVGEETDASTPEAKGPVLPLRLLVVADLLPRDEHNAGASAPEAKVRVDPAQLDDLFTRLRPRIAIDIPSVLAEGRNARIDLSLTSMKSFRPDGLIAEVPLLRSLLDGKLMLERLRDGSIDRDKARDELDRIWKGSPLVRDVLKLVAVAGSTSAAAAAAPARSGADDSALSSILDMVDTGAGDASEAPAAPRQTQSSSEGRFGAIIESFARSGQSSASRFSPQEAVSRVEKALGAQIGAILQHPEVRRLEQAWRSLFFLAERAKGVPGLKIDVLSARPELAATTLERAVREGSEAPVSVAIVDISVDGTAASLSRLEEIARIAETHAVPVLVNGSPALLGVDKVGDVERLDHKMSLFSAPHQAPWQSLAARPAMRWVTIAMNGALGRAAYDKQTSRVREAVVQEHPADEGAVVYLQPAYLVGLLIAQSFKDTRWPCRIVGNRSGGMIENLPVREVQANVDDADVVAIPTESFVSTDSQKELSKAGILLLASAPNSDAIYVLTAPTAYVPPPKRTYDSASTEPEARLDRVSLVDQLFVARLVQFSRALLARMPSNAPPAEMKKVVEGALWTLFEDARPGSVELSANVTASSDGTTVSITVTPRRFLGVTLDELSFEMPLA